MMHMGHSPVFTLLVIRSIMYHTNGKSQCYTVAVKRGPVLHECCSC